MRVGPAQEKGKTDDEIFLNQPINYINFSIDLLWGHIIRPVNMVHEDSIMLRFQAVQKMHP